MSTGHVMHDERRWKIVRQFSEDGAEWYELRRSKGPGRGLDFIVARVTECEPDHHERRRTIKADGITLSFNVARGIVTIRKGRSTGYNTTLSGIYTALAQLIARNKARDRAFRRRTKR